MSNVISCMLKVKDITWESIPVEHFLDDGQGDLVQMQGLEMSVLIPDFTLLM